MDQQLVAFLLGTMSAAGFYCSECSNSRATRPRCGPPRAARPQKMAAASDGSSAWAEMGDLVDPISLEPLSSLSCPPFELRADTKQRSASDWSAE